MNISITSHEILREHLPELPEGWEHAEGLIAVVADRPLVPHLCRTAAQSAAELPEALSAIGKRGLLFSVKRGHTIVGSRGQPVRRDFIDVSVVGLEKP